MSGGEKVSEGKRCRGEKVSGTFFSQEDRYLFRPPRISATRSKEAGRMAPRVGWGMPLRSSDCKPPLRKEDDPEKVPGTCEKIELGPLINCVTY